MVLKVYLYLHSKFTHKMKLGRPKLDKFEKRFKLIVYVSNADIAQDRGISRFNKAIDRHFKPKKNDKA